MIKLRRQCEERSRIWNEGRREGGGKRKKGKRVGNCGRLLQQQAPYHDMKKKKKYCYATCLGSRVQTVGNCGCAPSFLYILSWCNPPFCFRFLIIIIVFTIIVIVIIVIVDCCCDNFCHYHFPSYASYADATRLFVSPSSLSSLPLSLA